MPIAKSNFEINKFIAASKAVEFDIEEVGDITFLDGYVDLPTNLLTFRYLMEAIGRSTSIKQLFLHSDATPEQWEFIIKALKRNSSIDTIYFSSNNMAYIGRAVKAHATLTTGCFVLEENAQDNEVEELASALATSKALTSFELRGPFDRPAMPPGKILPLLNALKEHRGIVKCRFSSMVFSADTGHSLASMIRYNEGLKHLTFNYCDIDPLTDPLYDILKLNTSITDLDLSLANFTIPHMVKILQIFKENTTITSLTLDGINLNDKAVTDELTTVLKTNTLKKLSLADCHVCTDDIAKGLALNKSLTWLSLAKNRVRGEKLKPFLHKSNVQHLILNDCTVDTRDCPYLFQELADNKSLTNLQMRNIPLQEPALNALASLLDLNTTLRVLHIKRDTPTSLPMRPVLMALARNNALRVLHIDKIKEQYHPEWDFLRGGDVLKPNYSLCQLTINGESDPLVDSRLKQNRDRFNGVIVFLKMLIQRPDAFLEVFPLEIWVKIFSYVEGVDINTLFPVE